MRKTSLLLIAIITIASCTTRKETMHNKLPDPQSLPLSMCPLAKNSITNTKHKKYLRVLAIDGGGIRVYRPAIIKNNSSNEEKFWPRLSATIK